MHDSESEHQERAESVTFFEEDVCKCALFLVSEARGQEKSRLGFLLPATKESEPTNVLIALSGGIDSTALLLALAETRSLHNLELNAAHFNHNLRGVESVEDEAHCQRLCLELDIPLYKGSDTEGRSRYKGRNPASEDALRRRRYDFLETTASAIGAQFILTGHNLDDQAETILFRLLRGTALSGMRGIQPWRQLTNETWLLRPLLGVPRAEIARYILSRQIVAREDSSNADCKYTRNFLRQQIMPLLKERFPAALRRIENFACTAGIDEDYLNNVARRQYEEQNLESRVWQVDTLKPLHQAILDRIVAMGLVQRNIQVTTDLIESVRKQIDRDFLSESEVLNARFSIDKTWDLVRHLHYIQWLNKFEKVEKPAQFAVRVRVPGSTLVAGLNKAVQIEEYSGRPSQDDLEIAVNLSQLETPLILRRREPGDFIQPAGQRSPTTLKKYLHRKRASQSEELCRARVDTSWSASHCLVLASASEILWIPGIGISEKLKPAPGGNPSHTIRLVDLVTDNPFC